MPCPRILATARAHSPHGGVCTVCVRQVSAPQAKRELAATLAQLREGGYTAGELECEITQRAHTHAVPARTLSPHCIISACALSPPR